MDSKVRLFFIVELVFCVMFAITFAFEAYAPKKTVNTVKHELANFDSHSQNKALSSVKEFFEAGEGIPVGVRVGFRMKIENITSWDDIFQTAPSNAGVRVEISEPGVMDVVVGDGTHAGLIGFQIATSLEKKVWHTVMINIDKNKNLIVLLDGKETVRAKSPRINYKINEIAVGSGLSKSRPFDGQINNFSIEYDMEHENDFGFLFVIIRAMIIAGFLFCLPMIFTHARNRRASM